MGADREVEAAQGGRRDSLQRDQSEASLDGCEMRARDAVVAKFTPQGIAQDVCKTFPSVGYGSEVDRGLRETL